MACTPSIRIGCSLKRERARTSVRRMCLCVTLVTVMPKLQGLYGNHSAAGTRFLWLQRSDTPIAISNSVPGVMENLIVSQFCARRVHNTPSMENAKFRHCVLRVISGSMHRNEIEPTRQRRGRVEMCLHGQVGSWPPCKAAGCAACLLLACSGQIITLFDIFETSCNDSCGSHTLIYV